MDLILTGSPASAPFLRLAILLIVASAIGKLSHSLSATETIIDHEAKLASIFRTVPAGIGVVENRIIVDGNDYLHEMTGYGKEELIGRSIEILYADKEEFLRVGKEKYLQLEHTGSASLTSKFKRKSGELFDVLITSALIIPGNISKGVTFAVIDISETKKLEAQIRSSLAEKEMLLKEIHHRVKNSLNLIVSLLNLQKNLVHDPKDMALFDETQDRIISISQIHEKLYRTTVFTEVEGAEYLKEITNHLFHSYDTGAVDCIHNFPEEIRLPVEQAVPCGLIVNELVTNALKYAFQDEPVRNEPSLKKSQSQRKKEIHIGCVKTGEHTLTLTVRDNGSGFPEGFDSKKSGSLGLTLIHALTDQLDGSLRITADQGVHVEITFPLKTR